ncbi:cell division protein FtsZ [Erythrobacter sp.]|jgi:cell division protein FtsZ|uniref:cell division protein FtsZ n=1 Tax=Erythrobacter sp. TaxID=1042 RepID=UPI002EB1BE59|nr:cell division protein FtsZ [Erythrobacter sp.]
MSINIGPAAAEEIAPRITVIGIGGAGGNAIANMIAAEIEGVDFIVANTDAQALSSSPAERRIQLGPDITGGLGAGARPEVGKAAAEETVAEIEEALEGVNMVFIAAGMGGGTGTGAAPVIAEAARRRGVLTVGVVTKPFLFEGTRRMRAAEAGIAELQQSVDTLIVIPNQNLFLVAKAETTFKEAFQLADEVLQQGVRSITDLMVMPGLINLDFADVRSVMSEMGKAMMGTGEGEGENRALEAAEQAIANPLLDGVSMQGAKGVIISIIGGEDMKLLEVDEAANHIRELVDEDANIIWGSAFNPDLDGKIRVSVVATGIEQSASAGHDRGAAGAALGGALGGARAPKRPVLELPGESELDAPAVPAAEADDTPESEPELSVPTAALDDGEDYDEEEDYSEPFDLTGMQAGDEMGELEGDDVDDIVDPLAGLRGAEDDEEPLDLTGEYTEEDDAAQAAGTDAAGDDLLADADRLADADEPLAPRQGERRRGLLGGGGSSASADGAQGDAGSGPESGTGVSGGGSTLFERMANLSRSSSREDDEDDEDDDDGRTALSIPPFMTRQRNQ